MPKDYYMPQTDAGKNLWMNNLNAKLPSYVEKYNITKEEQQDVTNVHDDFAYRLQAVTKVAAYHKQWTAYKNALRDGIPVGATVQAPQYPNLGEPPTAAAPGGPARIATLVKKIKSNTAYSEADGLDMGIEGVAPIIDFNTLTPAVSIHTGSGGFTEIIWNKQDMDGVAIYKDSSDGRGFVLYDLDNHPNWQDKHPLPATGQSVIWKYKLIYRLNDEEVGQWSTVLSMTVAG